MTKKDILAAAIIGELNAWLFILIARIVDLDFPLVNSLMKFFPLLLPILAVLGICIASWIGRKFLFVFQFAKFILTGTLNTFIDLGIFNVLMWCFGVNVGLILSVFKGISFSVGVTNSYFWNKFWSFGQKEIKPGPKEFSKFYLFTGIGFLLNVSIFSLIIYFIAPLFGLQEEIWANVAAILAGICVCAWNFLSYKFIVFKK
jgi:putative flippase GtrA